MTRSYRGATGDERRSERRARLVAAGLDVFGTAGYRSATVDGVCAAAGLTKRYFYESFDGLESLLCAVYERIVEDLRAAIRTASSGRAPSAIAVAALGGFLDWAEAHPAAARVHLFEVLGVSPRVDALYQSASRAFAEEITAMLALPIEDGPRRVLGMMIVGAGLQIAMQWVLDGHRPPRADLLRDAAALFGTAIPTPG